MKRERPKREMVCKRCVGCGQREGVAILGLFQEEIMKLFFCPADVGVPGGVPGGVPVGVPVGVPGGVPGGVGVPEGVGVPGGVPVGRARERVACPEKKTKR